MNHKSSAKAHVRQRLIDRYGRTPSLRDIDNMRIGLKTGSCFFRKDCGDTIIGIVKFKNIHVSAVYSKELDGMVTAGCPLTGEIR